MERLLSKGAYQSQVLITCLNNNQPPQNCLCQLTDPQGWVAWLAKANQYVHNLFTVIKRLNQKVRAGI